MIFLDEKHQQIAEFIYYKIIIGSFEKGGPTN